MQYANRNNCFRFKGNSPSPKHLTHAYLLCKIHVQKVYEMLYSGHIAQKGAINEAVEMAKIYGKKESSGFINSVLDKVMKNEERKDSIVTEAAKEAMAEAPIKEDEKVTMIIEREVTEEEAEAILAGKLQ